MVYITNSNKKGFSFKFLFFVLVVSIEQTTYGMTPPMSPFGGFDQGGFGAPGAFGAMDQGFDPNNAMAGFQDMFSDPKAMEEIMKATEEMMKNPEFMEQMDRFSQQMGLPPVSSQELKKPTKSTKELDELYGYQTTEDKPKPKVDKKQEEKEESDLKQYSGYQKVLMSDKSTPAEKNKAFSEFSVLFNQVYQKIKGYTLLVDDSEPHLLAPMREELGKLVHGELCQANAAVITISENFSDKLFSDRTKDNKKLYKQLFNILDLAEQTFKKLENFAQLHDPSTKKGKKDIEVNDLQPEEIKFIDGSDKDSIIGLAEQISKNLTQATKLLEDPKLKDLYQKHLEQKGYKSSKSSPYRGYGGGYGKKYGSGNYSSKSGSPSKYGSKGYDSNYYNPRYPNGYDQYDQYQEPFNDAIKDSKPEDPGTLSSPIKTDDAKTKEPNKEATEVYLAIVGLADLKIFQTGQKVPQPEPLYNAVSRVVEEIVKTKSIATDLEVFLYQIFNLQRPSASKEGTAEPKDKLDSQTAQGYKDKFGIFCAGLATLQTSALTILPYKNGQHLFCHGIVKPEEHKKAAEKTIEMDQGSENLGAFAIPSASANSSDTPQKVVEKFISEVAVAAPQAKALEATLKSWQKVVSSIAEQTKTVQLQSSINKEFSTLHSSVASVVKKLTAQIQTKVAEIKNHGTTLAQLKDGFFKGINAKAKTDWLLFQSAEELQKGLLALRKLVITYKIEFPQTSFQELDSTIEQSLEKVWQSTTNFCKAFEALETTNLENPAPGAAAPAAAPQAPQFLAKATGGALDQDFRDCTREFLIGLSGVGGDKSKVQSESDQKKKQNLMAYQTFGALIKTIAMLQDNVYAITTGTAQPKSLNSTCTECAGKALILTTVDKTPFAEVLGKVKDYIAGGVEGVANFIGSLF